MYSEDVQAVSTEDQREVITTALSEAADWLEEDGYIAETKVRTDSALWGWICKGAYGGTLHSLVIQLNTGLGVFKFGRG